MIVKAREGMLLASSSNYRLLPSNAEGKASFYVALVVKNNLSLRTSQLGLLNVMRVIRIKIYTA